MRKIIACVLIIAILMSGCGLQGGTNSAVNDSVTLTETTESSEMGEQPEFARLDDEGLPEYVQDAVYAQLIENFEGTDYFIENVNAVYVSQEYIDELEYNSQENIYFGYTLSELENQFEGKKFVFTYDEDSKETTVKEFVEYDDTYEKALKKIAIGTGVILVCVTVSVVTGGTASAVSAIFATAAKTGTGVALSAGVISGATAGLVTGLQTGDVDKALKSAAQTGSDGFMWGAIGGSLAGGITEGVALKGATLNGLTMNQAAQIQKESKLPLDFIKSFHSVDEYNVYKDAGLQLMKVNGKYALVQKIDWNLVDSEGKTNFERVNELNLAPIDASGKSYELHHIGQKNDSPLAVLTNEEHHGNSSKLHFNTGQEKSLINRTGFAKEKKNFWKALCEAQTK